MDPSRNTTQYILKNLPSTARPKRQTKKALLKKLQDLRKRISVAWASDVSVVDEIRSQRTKDYEADDR